MSTSHAGSQKTLATLFDRMITGRRRVAAEHCCAAATRQGRQDRLPHKPAPFSLRPDREYPIDQLPMATENCGLSPSANPWSTAASVSREGGLREGSGLGQTGLPARAARFDGTGAPLGRWPVTELVPCETSKKSDYPAGNSRSCSTGDHRDHRLQASGAATQSRGKAIRTEVPAPQPSASRRKIKRQLAPGPAFRNRGRCEK